LVHLGDLGYFDVQDEDPDDAAAYRALWDTRLTNLNLHGFWARTPIAYIWSDHDFYRNGAHGGSPGKAGAQAVFRQYAPHYPLVEGAAIYHTFEVGRVRFIMLDTRSDASDPLATDNGSKTKLGATQKAWLKALLLANPDQPKVLCSDGPWVAEDQNPAWDNWGVYTTERQEIADYITNNNIRNLVILSGDTHIVAADDGTNSDAGIPNWNAAPFEHLTNIQGGPWSEGHFPTVAGEGITYKQYGWVDVEDEGGNEVTFTFTPYNLAGTALLTPQVLVMEIEEDASLFRGTSVGSLAAPAGS
jgi:phosphodiesterase/alkaline phosphatase D-like protein